MKKSLRQLFLFVACFLAMVATSYAAPLYSHDVFCHGEKCGTMEIDIYSEYKGIDGFGGVEIDGQYVILKDLNYHYIQSINIYDDDTPKRYKDDTTLPVPLIDPPPGGYLNNPFDYLVYYDEGEFPTFYDKPSTSLWDIVNFEEDATVHLAFETWLVCVISETFGPNPELAKDDDYVVATLLGWTWGYTIVYEDIDIIGTVQLLDFTVTKDAFAWIGTPSEDWVEALGQVYGADPQDWFNVALNDCDNCDVVPIPSVLLLLGSGLAGLFWFECRRFFKL